jgi:Cu(I)/Ag(I) efflux system membrane protein CusA/SilA
VIDRTVAWSARHPWVVLGVLSLLLVASQLSPGALARDVIPELPDPQISLVAEWKGHPATEVARRVTRVLTEALQSLQACATARGLSMTSMAYVDVVLASGASPQEARAAVMARVSEARRRLPPGVRVQVGPAAASSGWVLEYALYDPTHGAPLSLLRKYQEEVFGPAAAAVPGVAEVATVGGGEQSLEVEPDANALRQQGLAFGDLIQGLGDALGGRGVGAAEEPGLRPVAAYRCGPCERQLAALPLSPALSGRSPARVGELARVRWVDDAPMGLADVGGEPAVAGIVIAQHDADLPNLVRSVERALDRERHRLPPRVRIAVEYDRERLAERVHRTLWTALGEEIAVVALVVLLFLLDGRSALVPLFTLPAVVLLTLAGMRWLGVPATVMSLGGIGIALGVAVDADLVALEACHRRLEQAAPARSRWRGDLVEAARSFAPAIVTSMLMTGVAFLPVLGFTGEAGRLLRPLALTKTLVVASAALVAVTAAPALRDRLLVAPVRPELGNPLMRALLGAYRPFVRFALRHPKLTLATGMLALFSCVPIASRLGGEFLPRMDEGDLLYMPTTLPGISAEQAREQLARQDHALAAFDEVESVLGKVGRAETATDPAPLSMAETTIRLRDRSSWPLVFRPTWYTTWAPAPLQHVLRWLWPDRTPETREELIARLDRAVQLPGWTPAWTAPARARMDMLSTGVRTPVAIRVVSPDPARLDSLGRVLRNIALRAPGARSAVYEGGEGESWPSFALDTDRLARFGVDRQVAAAAVDFATSGGEVGQIEHDGNVVPVRVDLEASAGARHPLAEALRALTVRARRDAASGAPATMDGPPVALGLLGHPATAIEPAALRTEGGELVAYVHVDLEDGADVEGYVERARREISAAAAAGEIVLGPGERVEWAGQHALVRAGEARLMLIAPAAMAIMVLLLFLQFRSWTEAFIVALSIPFALVGSIWTLYLLGYPLSAPVWVGLLSVVGLAMQTGVVMVVYIDDAFHRRVSQGRLQSREDIVAAHEEGTVGRLRPKLMTVATMAASLLPLLWSEGAGAEIMRRVAAPMIGGVVTSAFLTLEILPVLYTMWRHAQLRRAQRTGAPLMTIVGEAPGWAAGRRRPVETARTPPAAVGAFGVKGV